MQTLNRAVFVNSGLCRSLLDAIDRGIESGDIRTDESGRLLTRATIRSIAGMSFDHNGSTVSIAGLIAAKNGYAFNRICLRGSDFTESGADFVTDILQEFAPYLLPQSKAKPAAARNNVGQSRDVLADLGL